MNDTIQSMPWASDTRKNRRGLQIDFSLIFMAYANKRFYLHPAEFGNRIIKDVLIMDREQIGRAGTVSDLGKGLHEVNLFREMKPGKIYQYMLYWNWGADEKTIKKLDAIDTWKDEVQS